MKIIIIRHGETDYNKRELIQGMQDSTGINKTGVKQITELLPYLKNNPVVALYSSTLTRALESAQIISEGLSLPVLKTEALRERNWGELSNTKWVDVQKMLESFSIADSLRKRYEFTPQGGESWKDVENRSLAFVDKLITQHTFEESVILVTHGGLMRAILPILLKQPRSASLDYSFANGSITELLYDKTANSYSLLRMNWIP